jgi:hypothetical protein
VVSAGKVVPAKEQRILRLQSGPLAQPSKQATLDPTGVVVMASTPLHPDKKGVYSGAMQVRQCGIYTGRGQRTLAKYNGPTRRVAANN